MSIRFRQKSGLEKSIRQNARRTRNLRQEKTGISRKEKRKGRISWLFLSPSLLGVLTFFLLPFCVIIFYAFVNNPIQKEFVGIQNFINVWDNNAFKRAGWNTLRFSFTAVPLAVMLSLLLAVIMESKIRMKSQFRTFFLTPMMVPVASIVLIWQVLFHYNGTINEVLIHLNLIDATHKIDWFNTVHAQVIIVVLFLWKNLGYNMILFMAALSSVPQDVIEVAELESATKWQIFWKIRMRYISSTILFVTIMSLINSFKVFREIYLLTGDYPYESLYMLQHYMNNKFQSLDYQALSTAAIIMSVVIIVLVFIMFRFEDVYGKDVEG